MTTRNNKSLKVRKDPNYADGSEAASIIVRERKKQFDKKCYDRPIKKTQPIVITGYSSAGKTRRVLKLQSNYFRIWKKHRRAPPIYVNPRQPISAWLDHSEFETYMEKAGHKKNSPVHRKTEFFMEFIKKYSPIIFIEDGELLRGQKLQFVCRVLAKSKVWVMSCSHLNELAPELRAEISKKPVQEINLVSQVSYDMTGNLVAIIVLIALAFQFPTLAIVMGSAGILAKGRGSSRNR